MHFATLPYVCSQTAKNHNLFKELENSKFKGKGMGKVVCA
jgi:hypothetical protein